METLLAFKEIHLTIITVFLLVSFINSPVSFRTWRSTGIPPKTALIFLYPLSVQYYRVLRSVRIFFSSFPQYSARFYQIKVVVGASFRAPCTTNFELLEGMEAESFFKKSKKKEAKIMQRFFPRSLPEPRRQKTTA